jgi:hypothetical protein
VSRGPSSAPLPIADGPASSKDRRCGALGDVAATYDVNAIGALRVSLALLPKRRPVALGLGYRPGRPPEP